jgi:hypothetical protein
MLDNRCIYAHDYTMKRVNLNIREDQHSALMKMSKNDGPTMSALVRKAIDSFLKKQK